MTVVPDHPRFVSAWRLQIWAAQIKDKHLPVNSEGLSRVQQTASVECPRNPLKLPRREPAWSTKVRLGSVRGSPHPMSFGELRTSLGDRDGALELLCSERRQSRASKPFPVSTSTNLRFS